MRLNPVQARNSKLLPFHCPNNVNHVQGKWLGVLSEGESVKVRYSGDLLKGVELELEPENMGREGKGGKYQSKQRLRPESNMIHK